MVRSRGRICATEGERDTSQFYGDSRPYLPSRQSFYSRKIKQTATKGSLNRALSRKLACPLTLEGFGVFEQDSQKVSDRLRLQIIVDNLYFNLLRSSDFTNSLQKLKHNFVPSFSLAY